MVVEPATELKPRLLICYTNFNRARWYGAVQYNQKLQYSRVNEYSTVNYNSSYSTVKYRKIVQ